MVRKENAINVVFSSLFRRNMSKLLFKNVRNLPNVRDKYKEKTSGWLKGQSVVTLDGRVQQDGKRGRRRGRA